MESAVHDFRPRAARHLAAFGALALVPFAVVDLAAGDWMIALPMLVLSGLLVCGVWALDRGRYSVPLVLAVFGLPAIVVNAVGLARVGIMSSYWSFVIAAAYYLVLPRRWAVGLGAALLVVLTPAMWVEFGGQIASRYGVSLGLVALFGHATVRLIDDRQQLLVDQMMRDPLTGVFNRSTLTAHLERAARSSTPATLLALDVDHFKSINDRFGHDTGDRVLRDIAEVMLSFDDPDTTVYRVGGEEFLMVVERTDAVAARQRAEMLLERIRVRVLLGDHTVTASVGLAEADRAETIREWLARADRALYASKHDGRDRLTVG